MPWMESPWAGLMEVASRTNVWSVLQAMEGKERTLLNWVKAGLTERVAQRVMERRWEGEALVPEDEDWPLRLRGLPQGPVALMIEGNRSLLSRRAVAIIGSRACTAYGRMQAKQLSEEVVGAGGVVVSGMAAGIDAEAHLAAGGNTIAVLGQGIGAQMSVWQQRLRAQILKKGGLIVSEFPPGQTADRWTFPVRNRVIAALAQVVVVVEAGEQSGTRITADHALRFGREVMAVPGPLDAPASVGCLQLLSEGATLVRGPATVLGKAGLAGSAACRYEGANATLSSPTS